MNRITRITAILIQLQSKNTITAKEIAERFDISLRTVYRDIKTLIEAGVPIGSENGIGYFIVDGYRLPPISFTEEEANTLIILEELIKGQGDTSITTNFHSLLIKIKATLKKSQKEKVEFLASRIFSLNKMNNAKSNWLSDIQMSISNNKVIEIKYTSLSKKEQTTRCIEPLGIYFTNGCWVVIAYCLLRKEIREFRLDKIFHLKITKEDFNKSEFNLYHYYQSFQS